MRLLVLGITLIALCAAYAQVHEPPYLPPPPGKERDTKLPNGKSQNEEILKADYQKTLKDAQDLVDLAQALQAELQKDDSHVLSLNNVKKTEEIEKIAKRMRSRMMRF